MSAPPPPSRLPQNTQGVVNVTNSFALPFEEDDKDPKIWFLDHNYLENMFAMFKKVNGERTAIHPSYAPCTSPSRGFGRILSLAAYSATQIQTYVLRNRFLFVSAARERIVGWYSTGPKIRSSDCESPKPKGCLIHALCVIMRLTITCRYPRDC